MIKILIASILLLPSFSTTPSHGGELDVTASTVKWVGKKVAGSHEGTINIKSGHLDFANHKLIGGHFVIDMTSITCTDLDGEWAVKLLGHLASDDFFSTEAHQTAQLTITKVSGGDKDNYSLEGDLTIKGITKPISFDAEVKAKSAHAVLKIDRTAYGIKYGSGSFFDDLGDKAIDNEFVLTVDLVMK